ncbi:Cullin 1a [Capsaspora owczarzaki ATCC 30864]|uniref:Cullin 1a n=1 Tax=Capsaspora owczarzaki (strain ATCC 30864) TaxID=595528 RepID=A0A0D2TZK8_CAPO3|nr:Cullin 1a [Capsaspora owczarzaki ATCC 30864]
MTLKPVSINFDDKWRELRQQMELIVGEQSSEVSGMIFHEVCTARPTPFADKLFREVSAFFSRHVTALREGILEQESNLLPGYASRWSTFDAGTGYLHMVFEFYNKLATKHTTSGASFQPDDGSNTPMPIMTLAYKRWREHCFEPLKTRLLHNILSEIEKDRNGEDINSSVILTVVNSLVTLSNDPKAPLDLYKTQFEAPFLQGTSSYYRREAAAYIADHDISAYMRKAEAWLDSEQLRARKHLDSSSYSSVIKLCEAEIVTAHREKIQAECTRFIDQDAREDLTRMYHLLRRIPGGIDPMLVAFEQNVTAAGLKEIERLSDAAQKPEPYVDALLVLHSKHNDIIRTSFDNDNQLIAALDKAFRSIINDTAKSKSAGKAPELLAAFCDQLLKKSNKNQSEAEIEEKLQQVIKIFKYIEGKDIFQKFYSKFLAKRLIHGVSVSDEAESMMIAELKAVCGYDYTTKLQRMFTDMTVSEDINKTFNEFRSNNDIPLNIEFSMLVLQTGAWPLGSAVQSPFNIPAELEKSVTIFEAFYGKKYSGRKLNWLHHLSKGDLRATYGSKRYELQSTNYQMAILLQYNNEDVYSYSQLRQLTNLNDADLKKTVKSLVDVKLLNLDSGAEDVTESSLLKYNRAFSNKRTKIKITTAVQAETKEESVQTHKSVNDDRSLYLQAAIVRIMKSRKTLSHNQLVQEVIVQLSSRFQPAIPMIKKSIEGLIDKAYLERVENTLDKYNYLA